MKSTQMCWLAGAATSLATAYLLLGYVFHQAPVPLQAASAAGTCAHSEQRLVDKGAGPSGMPWIVKGMVQDNHGCDSWLLGMEFRPIGTAAGSSRWQWQIPVKGHLSNNFTLAAQDELAEGGRVFYGIASARVKTVAVGMSKGQPIRIRPKLPASQLRSRFVWLRNLRYFIYFYLEGRHARKVTLYSRDGKIVENLRRDFEGGFKGPGI